MGSGEGDLAALGKLKQVGSVALEVFRVDEAVDREAGGFARCSRALRGSGGAVIRPRVWGVMRTARGHSLAW